MYNASRKYSDPLHFKKKKFYLESHTPFYRRPLSCQCLLYQKPKTMTSKQLPAELRDSVFGTDLGKGMKNFGRTDGSQEHSALRKSQMEDGLKKCLCRADSKFIMIMGINIVHCGLL